MQKTLLLSILISIFSVTPSWSQQRQDNSSSRQTKPARDTGQKPPPKKGPDGFQHAGPKTEQLGPADINKKPYTVRIASTPDVNQHATYRSFLNNGQIDAQTKERLGFPEGLNTNSKYFPTNFCGPSAVANHLIWLDKTAYPNISTEPNAFAAATKLAYNLGTGYTKTITNAAQNDLDEVEDQKGKGTEIHDLLNGTLKFLDEKKIPVKAVRVTSAFDLEIKNKINARGAPTFFDIEKPDDSTIHSALHRRSIVVTLHGHYVPQSSTKFELKKQAIAKPKNPKWSDARFERTGGHYAAPVGYGKKNGGSFIQDVTLYHDSSARNRNVKHQTIYDWDKVTKDNFEGNPLLIRYMKGAKLPREKLRCYFAPKPILDTNGNKWSAECRGNLRGHSVAHWRVNQKDDPIAELKGGMPQHSSSAGDYNGADKVEVLEAVLEIEIVAPPKSRAH